MRKLLGSIKCQHIFCTFSVFRGYFDDAKQMIWQACLGGRVVDKDIETVNEVGAVERVAANTHAQGLAQTDLDYFN